MSSLASKRKRHPDLEGEKFDNGVVTPRKEANAPDSTLEYIQGLQTTSYDAVRTTLLNLKDSISLQRYDEKITALDVRIEIAKKFVESGGLGRGSASSSTSAPIKNRGLLDAWDLVDSQQQQAILPLILSVLSNFILLLSAHQPTHDFAEHILQQLLPTTDPDRESDSRKQATYWNRMQKYLANVNGSGSRRDHANPSTSHSSSDTLILATLQLLVSMTSFAGAKYAHVVFDSINWSMKSLSTLSRKRRKVAAKKDKKLSRQMVQVTLDQPDIRTIWTLFLLSFLRSPNGSSTSVPLRVTALSTGHEHYSGILKGLSHDSASVITYILTALHDGLLSDEAHAKLPRSSVVSLFNEWGCRELISLYERESDYLELAGIKETHSVADVAHHFLLSLCTHPGRGVCYPDNGWYGRKISETLKSQASVAQDRIISSNIFNKILFGVLRALSPSKSPKQAELALRIISAAPELTGPFLSLPINLEPRPSSLTGLAASTFIGNILELPLPSFEYKGKWRWTPPSQASCIDSLFPASITHSTLTRGICHSDRLVRLQALNLLARLLQRLLAFKEVCKNAAADLGQTHQSGTQSTQINENLVLTGSFGFQLEKPSLWILRWDQMVEEAKRRLPDIELLFNSSEKMMGSEASATNAESKAPHVQALILWELSMRAAWMQAEALEGNLDLSPTIFEKALQISMTKVHETQDSSLEANKLERLSRLHILRLISLQLKCQKNTVDLLSKMPNSSSSYVGYLLHMQKLDPNQGVVLISTIKQIISEVLQSSVLFEHNQDEWSAWDYAFSTITQPELYNFFDECLQRCLKTPYRYIELGRRYVLDDTVNATPSANLPASPLLFTLVEQYTIRFQKGLISDGDNTRLKNVFLHFVELLLPAIASLHQVTLPFLRLINGIEDVIVSGKDCKKEESQDLFDLNVAKCKLSILQGRQDTVAIKNGHKGYHEDMPNNCKRPLSSRFIDDAVSKKDNQILDRLHPSLENIFDNTKQVPTLKPHIYAYHQIFTKQNTEGTIDPLQDWTHTSIIEAKIFTRCAVHCLFLPFKRETAMRDLKQMIVQGILPEAFLKNAIYGNEALLQGCKEDLEIFQALVEITAESYSLPSEVVDQSILAGLLNITIDVAQRSPGELVLTEAFKLFPFMSSGQRQLLCQLAIHSNNQATLVCTAARDDGVTLSLEDVRTLKDNVCTSEQRISMLSYLGSPTVFQLSGNVEQDHKSVTSLVHFIVHSAEIEGADAALCGLLRNLPSLAADVLNILIASPYNSDIASKFPYAFTILLKSTNVGGMLDKMKDVSYTLAKLVFIEDDTVAISSAKLLAQLFILYPYEIEEALTSAIPSRPQDAFHPAAIMLATELFTIRPPKKGTAYVHGLVEKILLWLVRRFAEDTEDTLQTLLGVEALNELLVLSYSTLKPLSHLSEPVITAAIKNRLANRLHAKLIHLLLLGTDLDTVKLSSTISEMLEARIVLGNPLIRSQVIETIHSCVLKDKNILTMAMIADLVSLYKGSLSREDRQIMQILQLYEQNRGLSLLELLKSHWSPSKEQINVDPTTKLVWRMDEKRAFETCLRFPRGRGMQNIIHHGYEDTEIESLASIYDPIFVLATFGSFLADSDPLTGLSWIDLLRSNILSVVCCCLSSKCGDMRSLSATLLAQTYEQMLTADFFERDQMVLVFDAMRNCIGSQGGSNESGAVPPIPLTTTIFIAFALRAIAQPSHYLYLPISRFFLQRAAPVDKSDVPLLYNSLYGSSTQSPTHRQERLFMLRFLSICLRYGGRTEWRIMKRRHVWHASCALYLASNDKGLHHVIHEVWEAACGSPHVALSVVLRQGFLDFLFQVFLTRPESSKIRHERGLWLRLLSRLLVTLDLDRVELASGPTWISSISRLLDYLTGVTESEDDLQNRPPDLPRELLELLSTMLSKVLGHISKNTKYKSGKYQLRPFIQLTQELATISNAQHHEEIGLSATLSTNVAHAQSYIESLQGHKSHKADNFSSHLKFVGNHVPEVQR